MRKLCLLCYILAAAGGYTAHAQTGKEFFPAAHPPYRGLIAAGSGFVIENPEMIAGSGVSRVSVSPDGRYVLAVRYRSSAATAATEAKRDGSARAAESAPPEISLTLWDSRDDRATVVWRERPPAGTSISMMTRRWFAGSSKALVSVSTQGVDENGKPTAEGSIFIVDAASRSVHQTVTPDDSNIYPNPSSTQPFAFLASPEGSAADNVRFVGADGALTPPVKIPGFVRFTRWSPDGTEIRGFHSVEKPDHTSTDEWYAVNPASQTMRPIPEPPKNSKGETDYGEEDTASSSLPFRLIARPNGSLSAHAESVWLEASDGSEEVQITSDGSPLGVTRFAALYTMAGGLYAAPIREIGAPALAQLRQSNVRKATIERAQVIGRALITYTRTHAKLFPDSSADLAKSLGLTADPAVLKDFTYQPAVLQKLTRFNDPQTVMLGFVTAPGGKAVIYTDGLVKWEDVK